MNLNLFEKITELTQKTLFRMLNFLYFFDKNIKEISLEAIKSTVIFGNSTIDSFISAAVDFGLNHIENKFNRCLYLNVKVEDNPFEFRLLNDEDKFIKIEFDVFEKEFDVLFGKKLSIAKSDGIIHKLRTENQFRHIMFLICNFNFHRLQKLIEITNFYDDLIFDACIDHTMTYLENKYNSGKFFGNYF